MTEKEKYITDEKFTKMSKRQKMEMPMFFPSTSKEIEISKLVIVPTNSKSSGYRVGSFFAYTPTKGWWRPMNYDCWQVVTDFESPAKPRHQILKGDFENGGVQIFSFMDEHHKAYMTSGGQIIIKSAPKS